MYDRFSLTFIFNFIYFLLVPIIWKNILNTYILITETRFLFIYYKKTENMTFKNGRFKR